MIEKSVLLPLTAAAAFELFTTRASDWWPGDRRHTQDDASEIFLLESGRFYERARDGREAELGSVRSWNRATRILLDFYIATGPETPTEVEITFVAQEGGTLVTVKHRPKAASEELWSGRASRYERSWDAVLSALSRAASQGCLP